VDGGVRPVEGGVGRGRRCGDGGREKGAL